MLSSIYLCALLSEMLNIEKLLGSLGLLAYRCYALDECTKALTQYGIECHNGGGTRLDMLSNHCCSTVSINYLLEVTFPHCSGPSVPLGFQCHVA